jgi:hypothetical protein
LSDKQLRGRVPLLGERLKALSGARVIALRVLRQPIEQSAYVRLAVLRALRCALLRAQRCECRGSGEHDQTDGGGGGCLPRRRVLARMAAEDAKWLEHLLPSRVPASDVARPMPGRPPWPRENTRSLRHRV